MHCRIAVRALHFLFRHRMMLLLTACSMLFCTHALRSRPSLSLYDRVFLQDISDLAIPGRNVTLKEFSMFVPDIWKDISQSQARHPALVAAYQARDFLGRQMTMVITLQENTSGWERPEIGDIFFTTWYVGEGKRLYRIDVQASSARSAASDALCRSLRCMLSSMKNTVSGSRL